MTWTAGQQQERDKYSSLINEEILSKKGFIEEREANEVLYISGATDTGQPIRIRLAPEGTQSVNPAFDVTPGRLVSGIITERGVCQATEYSLLDLYPEKTVDPS